MLKIDNPDAFHLRMVSELTDADRRAAKKPGHNPYALPQYLAAASEATDLIKSGYTPEGAFAEVFTPSRMMHSVALRLDLDLAVDRGRWICPA